jgi:serine/threonine protein kinase
MDLEAIRWFAKQILGMAGALDAIHLPRYGQWLAVKSKYGRHGDITPKNILWYPSSAAPKHGILVVADLGLTAMHSTQSRSKVPNQGIAITPDYKPPESELEGSAYSRAFDIWSFGCVLLEMVCWTLGGERKRDGFERGRQKPWISGIDRGIFFDVMRNDP